MEAPRGSVTPQHRILVLGSDAAGKSTLIVRYLQNVFIAEFDPTSASLLIRTLFGSL